MGQRAWLAVFLGLGTFAACAAPQQTENVSPLIGRIYIEAPYDEVWDRFTRAELFEDWYTVPCIEFGTEPGDRLVWATEEREIYRGRFLWAEKGRGLGWEFKFVGFDFDEPMTRVDFKIVENGPTVLIDLRHDVRDAPGTAAIISDVGWTKPLSRLKTLLESGQAMPWPQDG